MFDRPILSKSENIDENTKAKIKNFDTEDNHNNEEENMKEENDKKEEQQQQQANSIPAASSVS